MPFPLLLLVALICAMPIVGIGMAMFCKKAIWKVMGLVLLIGGITIFVHEGVGMLLAIYFNP